LKVPALLAAIAVSFQASAIDPEAALRRLASDSPEEAARAARELVSMGEVAIPGLMELRGDGRFFRIGNNLLPDEASTLVPVQAEGGGPERGRVPTIELGAIYLICAIARGNVEFANSMSLVDLTLPPESRRPSMVGPLVERAWDAVERWDRLRREKGLARLPESARDPLAGSGVGFR
jgi:hypothetical protein